MHILETASMLYAAHADYGVPPSEIEDGLRRGIGGLGRLAVALATIALTCVVLETTSGWSPSADRTMPRVASAAGN